MRPGLLLKRTRAFLCAALISASLAVGSSASATPTVSLTPGDPTAGSATPGTYTIGVNSPSATAAKCVEVNFLEESVNYSGDFNDSRWEFNGTAIATNGGQSTRLVGVGEGNSAGSAVFLERVRGNGFHVSFDAYIGDGTGADGIAFALFDANSSVHLGHEGSGVGFADTYGTGFFVRTFGGQFFQLGTTDGGAVSDVDHNWNPADVRNATHHYDVDTSGNVMTVKLDGSTILTGTVSLPQYAFPAFTAGTGGSDDNHIISNVQMQYGGPTDTVANGASLSNFNTWELNGAAALQSAGSAVQLTTVGQGTSAGSVVLPTALPSTNFTASFDAYSGGGSGADGWTFAFMDPRSVSHLGGTGGDLGFRSIRGVAVQTISYGGNTMAVSQSWDDNSIQTLSTNNSPPSVRNTVQHFVIQVTGGHLIVTVDGTQAFDVVVTLPYVFYPAFTGGQGGLDDDHIISNMSLSYADQIPTGMALGATTLAGSTALTSASWGTGTVYGNRSRWTNASGEALSTGVISFTSVTHNPNQLGTYSARLKTYSDVACTVLIESSAMAFVINQGITVSAIIDPTLTFTVAGRSSVCNGQPATNFQNSATATSVALGHMTAATVAGGAQDLSVSTNAANGFSVYIRTPGTTPNSLRDGAGHSISDVSGTNASPGAAPIAGTEGFGYSSSDTSTAFTSNTWAKLTNANAAVMIGTSTETGCVGYELALATTTPAGSYSTTVVYTAVPLY